MAYYGLIEVVLVFGGVLAFVVWQLRDVKKAQRNREEAERSRQSSPDPKA